MQTEFKFKIHPSEDLLEEYAFRRLSEDQIAPIEEHLLLCSDCQEALAEIDDYVLLMKTATSNWRASPSSHGLEPLRRWIAAFEWRGLAWMTAGAIACFFGFMYISPHSATAPVTVALASFRGGEDLTKSSHVPARSPLQLQIDAGDSPSAPSYRVEVVTANGQKVWTGEPRLYAGKLEASVSPGLDRGLYWVRLYAATSAELLSEFPLRVE